jgi:hypothetical protein
LQKRAGLGGLQKKCPDGSTLATFPGIIVVWRGLYRRSYGPAPTPLHFSAGSTVALGAIREASGDNARDPLAPMRRTPSILQHANAR